MLETLTDLSGDAVVEISGELRILLAERADKRVAQGVESRRGNRVVRLAAEKERFEEQLSEILLARDLDTLARRREVKVMSRTPDWHAGGQLLQNRGGT